MKTCTKCGIKKELTVFVKDDRYRDGYQNQCRSCRSHYSKILERKKSLLRRMKIQCKREGCTNTLGFKRIIYCSEECNDKVNNSKEAFHKRWLILKSTPGYKEYHRKVALRWFRKHQAIKKSLPAQQ